MKIASEDFIIYVKSMEGKCFLTQFRGKPFTIENASNGFFFTPQSTGKTRFHDFDTLRRILEKYNHTSSLHPKDYFDITMNASYTLALIKIYVEHKVSI